MHNMTPKKVYDIPEPSLYNETEKINKKQEDIEYDGQAAESTEGGDRHKRDVTMQMPERTVETLVVVDKLMYEYHESEDIIEPYVLTIMNIVSDCNIIF